MARCPKCGSTSVQQHRMPYGPMWCTDCGFRVKDKTATPNPFLEAIEEERAGRFPGVAGPTGPAGKKRSARSWLRAALYGMLKAAARRRDADPHKATAGDGQGAEPADNGDTGR